MVDANVGVIEVNVDGDVHVDVDVDVHQLAALGPQIGETLCPDILPIFLNSANVFNTIKKACLCLKRIVAFSPELLACEQLSDRLLQYVRAVHDEILFQ